jgi:acetolactate synthase-1/2/3 large subunit
LSVPQVGYNFPLFARAAKKIIVDIDSAELKKPSLKPDLPIQADAKEFMIELLAQLKEVKPFEISSWLQRCQSWKQKYPVALPEYKECKDAVNSFYFVQVLSEKLDEKAVIITDMGTSFTCTMQTFKTKLGQRLSTSSGHASMGFGLPGAIGACCGNHRSDTICNPPSPLIQIVSLRLLPQQAPIAPGKPNPIEACPLDVESLCPSFVLNVCIVQVKLVPISVMMTAFSSSFSDKTWTK